LNQAETLSKYTIRIIDDHRIAMEIYHVILIHIFHFDQDSASKLAIKLKTSGNISINNLAFESLKGVVEASVNFLDILGLKFSYQTSKAL
jgi:ATP-dependent Clp protease adapter protein ClpS